MDTAGFWRSHARSSRGRSLLLLDEPAAGLNHRGSACSDLIARIRDAGSTVVLVEHHMDVVMQVCDEITVLNYGAGSQRHARTDPGQSGSD